MKKYLLCSLLVLLLLYPSFAVAQSGSYIDTIYRAGQEGDADAQYGQCTTGTCGPDEECASGTCVPNDTCTGSECASTTCTPTSCPDGECVDGKCVETPQAKLKAKIKSVLKKIRDILNRILKAIIAKLGGPDVSIDVITVKPIASPKNDASDKAKKEDAKKLAQEKAKKEATAKAKKEAAKKLAQEKAQKVALEKAKKEADAKAKKEADAKAAKEKAKKTANKYVRHDNFEAAKKAAKAKGHPIMMVFSGSDWCGWCKKFESEVLLQGEFKDYAKNSMETFVADYPRNKPQSAAIKKQNKALMAKYQIKGFPTVLIVTAEGKIIKKTGYLKGGAGNYVKHLKTIIK